MRRGVDRRAPARSPGAGALCLLLLCAGAALPAGAAWREAGLSAAVARWEIGEAQAGTQVFSRFHAEWSRGEAWEARLELGGARTARAGATLGPRAEGSLLLRLRPASRWLFQAGLRAPGGLSDLDPERLALAREAGEPLLALPEPEPVRGLRLHAGAVRAIPLGPAWSLALAAGLDGSAALEVAAGATLDPGERASAAATLETEQAGQRLQAHLEVSREGEETLEGAPTRAARVLAGGGARWWFEAPQLRGLLAAGFASSGTWTLPDPEIHGETRDAGPARLGRALLELRPGRALGATPGAAWQPALTLAYTRLFPGGLPLADGWQLRVAPALAWVRGAREVLLCAAWDAGRLRSDGADGSAGDELAGWTISLGARWRLGAAAAHDRSGGE